jgi:aminodeoxyfutalosine deaminase
MLGDPANSSSQLESQLAALPKAELHLHLEGAISPATVQELATSHSVSLSTLEIQSQYSYTDFQGFLGAFKWVTSLLRVPSDYGLIARRLAEELLRQHVVYAELTVSAGVMRLRKQDIDANFAALHDAAMWAASQGLEIAWIFDAVRQFGPEAALDVARDAARLAPQGVVALGLGGDELSIPAAEFRSVYDFARAHALHLVVHAGEIGGPEEVSQAVELLGTERIGHGIAVIHDAALRRALAKRQITLEICPTSNLRTGALARQLGRADASISSHPLKFLCDEGLAVALATDDPAMFRTTLVSEYMLASQLGMAPEAILRLAAQSFESAFIPAERKNALLRGFHQRAAELKLA